MNYGSMGAVIAHEITHAFDDQGRLFDADGNLSNWWTHTDLKNFNQRAECIVDQFNAFAIEDGTHVNGKLVAGESIADLGGLEIAYAALEKTLGGKSKPVIDGFSPEQRFFLGWAHRRAAHIRPELARLIITTDPHPLPKFRVNGPHFKHADLCASISMLNGSGDGACRK